MTLAADQRAMLGLLLEKGQSYADLGTLLGIPEAEVRERARVALAELGGGDPDRHVRLTDYLLGQADPIGRADAVRHLRDDPDDRALAERVLGELQAIAPGAELPKLPGEPRTPPHLRAPRVRAQADGAPGRFRTSLSQLQTRVVVGLAAAAVIIVVAVLAIAGVFSSSGSSGGSATAGTGGSTRASGGGSSGGGGGGNGSLVPITLKGVGGSPGTGLATFGVATGDQAYIDVRTRSLPQAPSGQVYSLWLVVDPSKGQGYPVAPLTQTHQQFPIPSALTPILTSVRAVDIAVSSVGALRTEIKRVLQAKKPKVIIPEVGNVAMRGIVPAKLRSSS